VVVVETTVDGDMSGGREEWIASDSESWVDWCGGNGGGGQPAFISERVTPATGTSVEPNLDDHFPLPHKSRRSVILMTLISFFIFQFLISISSINKNEKIIPTWGRCTAPWPPPPRVCGGVL